MSQEDKENLEDEAYTDSEMEAGRALIMNLIHSLQLEQSKAQLYFMLIPLAFSAGLLLGYYISFVNL